MATRWVSAMDKPQLPDDISMEDVQNIFEDSQEGIKHYARKSTPSDVLGEQSSLSSAPPRYIQNHSFLHLYIKKLKRQKIFLHFSFRRTSAGGVSTLASGHGGLTFVLDDDQVGAFWKIFFNQLWSGMSGIRLKVGMSQKISSMGDPGQPNQFQNQY